MPHPVLRDASLIACPDCDLLQRLPELAPAASARCPRRDRELWRRREDSLNRTLALTLAAGVLYEGSVVSSTMPRALAHSNGVLIGVEDAV